MLRFKVVLKLKLNDENEIASYNCTHHDFTIKLFLTYAQYMYNHEAHLLFPSQRKHMMRT